MWDLEPATQTLSHRKRDPSRPGPKAEASNYSQVNKRNQAEPHSALHPRPGHRRLLAFYLAFFAGIHHHANYPVAGQGFFGNRFGLRSSGTSDLESRDPGLVKYGHGNLVVIAGEELSLVAGGPPKILLSTGQLAGWSLGLSLELEGFPKCRGDPLLPDTQARSARSRTE